MSGAYAAPFGSLPGFGGTTVGVLKPTVTVEQRMRIGDFFHGLAKSIVHKWIVFFQIYQFF